MGESKEFLLERRTPAQRYVDDYTLQRQRNRPGKKAGLRGNRLFPRQPKGSRPGHRQPIVLPTLAGGTKNGKDGSNAGMSIGPEGGPPAGGGPRAQERIPPKPVQSLPPWKSRTRTKPATEGGNLILRASSRGRGNGLANQLPDRASYEVQGEVRYLTILARGGSRVVYP